MVELSIIAFVILGVALMPILPKIKKQFWLKVIIASPLINAFADVTTGFFTEGYLSTGLIRGILLLIVIFVLAGHIKYKGVSLIIWLFLLYLSFLFPLSSNLYNTINEFIKVIISFLMFPIGYYLLADPKKLNLLNKYFSYGIIVVIAQIILAQIFKLGESEYLSDSFYLGGAVIQVTYTLVIYVLVSPMVVPFIKKKKNLIIHYTLVLISIIVILIMLRRVSIVSLIGGYLVYLFFSANKTRVLKFGVLSIFVLTLTFPLYGDVLTDRFKARTSQEIEINEESRFGETLAVYQELSTGSIAYKLFGKELFNSAEFFSNHPQYFLIFGSERQLHVDYNILLHGAGIIGLVLYLLILFRIFVLLVVNKTTLNTVFFQEMRSVALSLLIVSLLISFSGSISSAGYRSLIFIYLGSFLGLIESSNKYLR